VTDLLHILGWPAGLAFVITLLAVPVVRRTAVAFQLYDRPDSGLKPHARPIPYLGGLAMYLGWLAALHAAMWLIPSSRASIPWIVAAGSILMLTGLVDDLRGLRPGVRLLVQVVCAGLLLYGGIGRGIAPALLHPLSDCLPVWLADGPVALALSGLICMGLLAGAANSTNLIDGLDGLCAGVLGISALGFALLAETLGRTIGLTTPAAVLPSVLAAGLFGMCLGFLLYNFNPASIFMGDSGSLLLGFNVAVVLILFGELASWRWFVAAVAVFGFPIFDTALAISRRALNHRPLFRGDRSHFYDQVRDRGFSVRQTVLICYAIGLAFILLGAACLRLPWACLIGLVIVCPIALALLAWRLGLLRVDDTADRSR
jgi:UDP-GlcNAc:undecaprenyl-phosphate GlcNAc-1-phosphate transferase